MLLKRVPRPPTLTYVLLTYVLAMPDLKISNARSSGKLPGNFWGSAGKFWKVRGVSRSSGEVWLPPNDTPQLSPSLGVSTSDHPRTSRVSRQFQGGPSSVQFSYGSCTGSSSSGSSFQFGRFLGGSRKLLERYGFRVGTPWLVEHQAVQSEQMQVTYCILSPVSCFCLSSPSLWYSQETQPPLTPRQGPEYRGRVPDANQ